jgi:transposase InsO family protein
MSRKADCWDNAPTESLWGSLKHACVVGRRFRTRAEAVEAVMNWLAFYNARRLHSTLDYVSLMQFERNCLAEQERRSD